MSVSALPDRSEAILVEAEQHLAGRNLEAAFACFTAAEASGAEPGRVLAGRWQAHMLRGDFPRAWLESDAIRALDHRDPHRFWQGEDLLGKHVIVRCLHGFGDAVQMFRYAPQLGLLAARVLWEVPPRLLPIARCFEGVEHVITWGADAPAESPAWDVQVECTELPYLFRTELRELPLATRYLHLPAGLVDATATAMGPRRRARIGLVWEAGSWNTSRSIPLSAFEELLREHVVWNLQGGDARESLADAPDATLTCGDGILPLAATIANLDAVVTVDTLAAHLAGALGVPVCLLLQHAADWRWMIGRVDSPWYPAVTLFRQPEPGDWASAIAEVRRRLNERFHRP